MRTIIYSVVLVFAIGCGVDTEKVREKKIEQVTTTVSSASTTGSTTKKDLKILAGLTKSSATTVFSIDAINGKGIAQAAQPISVSGEELTVAGWVVDTPNKTTAKKVFINIGDSDFPAAYGGERADVGKALGDAAYTNSSFMSKIPINEIGKGNHQLRLKVVAAKESVYYLTEKVDITIQ